MGEAKDWGNGLPLKAHMLGKLSQLEVHHIFPRSILYDAGHSKAEVNAVANYCFLTKNTNLNISNQRPEDYFNEIEKNHPGALQSQWIPMDRELWQVENYSAFLQARRELLANEANRRFDELVHGDIHLLDGVVQSQKPVKMTHENVMTTNDDLEKLNQWVLSQGLSVGEVDFDYADSDTGNQLAVFDLAWPDGLQAALTLPVAILLDDTVSAISAASEAGWRCFTDMNTFRRYVEQEVLKTTGEEHELESMQSAES